MLLALSPLLAFDGVYQGANFGTALTWDNQTLRWSDQAAGLRTWSVSYDVISYTLAVGETVSVADVIVNGVQVSKAETVAFNEAVSNATAVNKSELFGFAETLAKLTGQYHAESFSVAETNGKVAGKNAFEALGFVEASARQFGLNKDESIELAEVCGNGVGFVRDFAESLTVADALAKNFGLKRSEAFALVDAWRRQGDMVISDMILAAGDMTMEDFKDFMAYGGVPGYEKWRDFIPGDYEYREAMFRVVLESKNADRGLLTNLQATVDVPDMIDRGSATVTTGSVGVYVSYNRAFHIIPEITLAARGSVGANPIAPEFNGVPTREGFSVRLRDTVTGAYVTGSFTWAAHGY